MSVFSEQNARLAQGLVDAKTAIEAKKGSVTVAKTTPQIEEIVAGIATVQAGGSSSRAITFEATWDSPSTVNSFNGICRRRLISTKNIIAMPITFTDDISIV